MTKSFRCADAGVPCRKKIIGDTDKEVVEQAVEHAREKHGVDILQAQTLARFAQAAIRDEDADRAARA